MFTIDFETEAIVGNPILNPPKPVGFAIKLDHNPSHYFEMANSSVDLLKHAWDSGEDLIFHNAMFDMRVAEVYLGLPIPNWERVHDTQYLIYLEDPHAHNLSLKPSAERILGLGASARDELQEWVMANVPQATKKSWGAHISKAPIELIDKYACMDTDMTHALFQALNRHVGTDAYNVERQLMQPLAGATRHGIRVNRVALATAHTAATAAQVRCEQAIRAHLNAPTLNPHSGAELAAALDKEGKIKEWKLTPTGKKSTARKWLMTAIEDQRLMQLLNYTSAMQTCIGTFMEPWLAKSLPTGRLHPNWNQVRSHEGRGKGTRTGRLSSDDPNFQNIPVPFGFELPDGLMPMPNLRDFLLPDEGCLWVSRDFSSQEMRILAHFECGVLKEAFCNNPDLDPHQMVMDIVKDTTGLQLKRKHVKNIGFGIMYGMGTKGLAAAMEVSIEEATTMLSAYHQALPGIASLQEGTKNRGRNGGCITTWGGRQYYAEPPKLINGRYRSYEYKLLNYLIQGSAADQTKECMIDWFIHEPPGSKFLATVHDEINISVPEDDLYRGDGILSECMNEDHIDVPMRSTVEVGKTWGSIK